jgi:Ala-tRNA(Pro) deacylase
MATPTWIRNMLRLRGIPFQELHHPEVFTAQEVAQREHVSGHRLAKVVVALVDGRPVELILPASRRVNLERVRAVLNARQARLATEEEMARSFTDCELGAIPALRHWEAVDVLMDPALSVEGDIVFQAGTHQDAVRLSFRAWYDLVTPQVATFSEPAEPARV